LRLSREAALAFAGEAASAIAAWNLSAPGGKNKRAARGFLLARAAERAQKSSWNAGLLLDDGGNWPKGEEREARSL